MNEYMSFHFRFFHGFLADSEMNIYEHRRQNHIRVKGARLALKSFVISKVKEILSLIRSLQGIILPYYSRSIVSV